MENGVHLIWPGSDNKTQWRDCKVKPKAQCNFTMNTDGEIQEPHKARLANPTQHCAKRITHHNWSYLQESKADCTLGSPLTVGAGWYHCEMVNTDLRAPGKKVRLKTEMKGLALGYDFKDYNLKR